MFENLTTLDYIVLSTIACIVLTFITALFSKLIKIQNRMNDLSQMMYLIIKKYDLIDTSCDDIKHALGTVNSNLKAVDQGINDNIRSLSSSTDKVLEQFNDVSSEPYLPTPNITKMIRETILENINIEVLLSHNMTLPNKQSTQHIIDSTVKTYPNVDKEYLVKLCLAMIENFVLNNAGQ